MTTVARRITRGDGNAHADARVEDAGGRWITLIDFDRSTRRPAWRPILHHGSTWLSQDAHPHPSFDHAGRSVTFTTDPTVVVPSPA